jgi:hypothetical protein
METLLIWALVIAAIALITMLLMLLASERELKRQRLDIAALKKRLKAPNDTVSSPQSPGNHASGSSPELDSSAEQVRANEITIANMQCEIEALRAENSWLKRQSPTHETANAPVRRFFSWPSRAQSYAPSCDTASDLGSRKSSLVLPASAAAILVMALASLFFARGRPNVNSSTLRTANPVEAKLDPAASSTMLSAEILVSDESGSRDFPRDSAAKETLAPGMKETQAVSPATQASDVPRGVPYEIVRSTRVFSAPDEQSRALARVEAGMEIVVVGAQNGWLEVRSRHGRPPGFIRKDTVIRKR